MSDSLDELKEALAVYPEMHGFPRYEFAECATVEAAARRYLRLLELSDETVEKAAKAKWGKFWPLLAADSKWQELRDMRRALSAVLDEEE